MAEPDPGHGVDKSGNPVVDPTKNVLDKVEDAVKRLDDLRSVELRGLRDLIEAKFEGIEREFALIESRRIEQKNDTKTAVDAALSAAERAVREQAAASEKAIIKSETSVAEQSRQQAQTFSAQVRGIETTLGDTKDRVSKLETQKESRALSRTDTRSNTGMIVGIVGSVSGLLMLAAVIIIAVLRGTG